jgi:hypothetical protein
VGTAVQVPLDDQQPLDRAALEVVRRSFPANRTWEPAIQRAATSELLAERIAPRPPTPPPVAVTARASLPPIQGGQGASSCPEKRDGGAVCVKPRGHVGRHRWQPLTSGARDRARRPVARPQDTPVAPPLPRPVVSRDATKIVVQAGGVTITIDITGAGA